MPLRSGVPGFLLGLAPGALLGIAAVQFADLAFFVAPGGPWRAGLLQAWSLVHENLRGSVLPFALIVLAYTWQLGKLRRLLAGGEPPGGEPPLEQVLRSEQLLDLCANLFFGVGVIWTAIGMRDALIQALGDPSSGLDSGAFMVLQRMVDGGILLALSTTIVGGIGGYLMRGLKSVLCGKQLNQVYMHASRGQFKEGLAVLRRIEEAVSPAGDVEGEGR